MCGPIVVGLLVLGQESLFYRKPMLRVSEVYECALVISVFLDCDYDFERLILNEFNLNLVHSSPYSSPTVFETSGIMPAEITRLHHLEAWMTFTSLSVSKPLLSYNSSDFKWIAMASANDKMTVDYLPIDLYDVKMKVLACDSRIFLSANFYIPYPYNFEQQVQMSTFSCEKGFYLLLALQGKVPEIASSFSPIAFPVRFHCSNGGVLFDYTSLNIDSDFNDECATTVDKSYLNKQCGQYRSLTAEKLLAGIRFTASVEIRQLNLYQTDISVNAASVTFRANLADSNHPQTTTASGIQLKSQDLSVISKFVIETFV